MKTFLFVLLLGGSAFAADSVALSRVGDELTVTIKVNIADIRAASPLTSDQKRAAAMRRAVEHLLRSMHTAGKTDAEIDAEAAAKKTVLDAEAAQLKALKPSGSL